jgi:chromosome segregation ATPase
MTAPQLRAVDTQTGTTLPVVDAETFAIVCAQRDRMTTERDNARHERDDWFDKARTATESDAAQTKWAQGYAKECDELREQLEDMRETCDMWAERATEAERELSRLQDQAVRIQELTTELAAVRSERNTYRAAVSR